jgi:hypothetical protein
VLTGRCLCGGVRFEIDGRLGPVVYCHCSLCRRATGSAFATNASVAEDAVRVVAGVELVTEYPDKSESFRAFCSRCGSPVFKRHPARGITRVRLGTIDGDPGRRPEAHIWTGSKAPWDVIPDDTLPRYDEAPPLGLVAAAP